MPRSRSSEAGFTVVEMLVVSLVAGIVLLALANMLDASQRASARITQRIDSSQRGRVAECTANANSQSGIHLTSAGTVERSFCNGNAFCGILADSGGFVDIVENNCAENGGSNAGAGIRVSRCERP